MIGMQHSLFAALLSFVVGISSGLVLEDASFINGTSDAILFSRSLEEREVFYHCNNPGFSGKLSQEIRDVTDIVRVNSLSVSPR